MRNRLFVCVAALTLALIASPPMRAQSGGQAGQTPSNGRAPEHDVYGVWNIAPRAPGSRGGFNAGNMVPKDVQYTPWAQAKCDTEDHCKGFGGTADPYRKCDPMGPTRPLGYVHPFEITHTSDSPARIFIFYEIAHQWRTVYMDGRPLPKAEDLPFGPTYYGYSVGHWEGNNDLVIETVGLNDKTWIDAVAGHVHSEELKITERYHRVDRNNLELSITFDDPKAFTKSFTWGPAKYQLKTGPQWELQESDCTLDDEKNFENNVSNSIIK